VEVKEKDISENQKIMNRHYYAHQDPFLCPLFALIMRAKNHADRAHHFTLHLEQINEARMDWQWFWATCRQ
jgi:hypothetical protein